MTVGIRLSVVLDIAVDAGVYATVRVLTRIPLVTNRARPTALKASNDPTATAAETVAVCGTSPNFIPTHSERVDTIQVNKTQADGTPTTKQQVALAAAAFSQAIIQQLNQTSPPYPALIGAGVDGSNNWAASDGTTLPTPTQPANVSIVFPTGQFVAEFKDSNTNTVTSQGGPVPFGS